MSATIDFLPVWKKDATPEERFSEFVAMARKQPERFGKFLVIYEETMPNGNTRLRYFAENLTTNERLGFLVIAADHMIKDSEA